MDQAKIQMADGRLLTRVVRSTRFVTGQPGVMEGYCSVDGRPVKVRNINGSHLSFIQVVPDQAMALWSGFFKALQVHLQIEGWGDFTRIENGVRIRYIFNYETNQYMSQVDTRIISVKVVS